MRQKKPPYELFDIERATKILKNAEEVIEWIKKQIE